MAGMPASLLEQAAKKLIALEAGTSSTGPKPQKPTNKSTPSQLQLSIFGGEDAALLEIKKELEEIDIEHLTPFDALLKLQALKKKIG